MAYPNQAPDCHGPHALLLAIDYIVMLTRQLHQATLEALMGSERAVIIDSMEC